MLRHCQIKLICIKTGTLGQKGSPPLVYIVRSKLLSRIIYMRIGIFLWTSVLGQFYIDTLLTKYRNTRILLYIPICFISWSVKYRIL